MKRLIIKKLIVISQGEKKSREVGFSKGLNIIIGKNKTGKSSLIKSIFHTFGCRVKFEEDWTKLIDIYLLFFTYGEKEYCILRRKNNFSIIEINKESYNLIISTDSFHEYSNYLMKNIFNIELEFLTKDEKIINITPPLLFRFQYIDQDRGWQKIGESFINTQYILNWKDSTSKYVVGYLGEEYYKTKKEIGILTNKVNQLESRYKHYNELIKLFENDSINSENRNFRIDNDLNLSKKILAELDNLEKEKIKLREKISQLKNERYEKVLAMEMLKNNIELLNADHDFAMNQGDILICPFCGTEHINSIENRVEIVKDIQVGNQLVKVYRNDIKEIERAINEVEQLYKNIKHRYTKLKKQFEETKSGATVTNAYRHEGMNELIKRSKEEINKVHKMLADENRKLSSKKDYLEELKSDKKRNEIYDELKKHYTIVLNKLNIPLSYMKFNNFVQVLNKTGSELPRLVYAYHTALYLYNLKKGDSVFNFLVVDTPNQQGQDENNLANINSVLDLVSSEKGQFIIGTERETNFEERATTVIRLTEFKRCLTEDMYQHHIHLVDQFEKLLEQV